ncbi:MAG TPA: efflux RND transporter periplasmic adaptor subunit [Burkholderiales bacterium]|nr:efflux RND transporter periplasmic adaptor subunit [Burkholderiales bacterium]
MNLDRRRPFLTGALLIVALAAAGAVAWWLLQEPALPDGVLAGDGRVEATEVAVASKVTGRMLEMKVREGDRVRPGDLIALLSAEEIQRRVEQAESHVGAAEAQLRQRDEETRARLTEAQARLRAARERLQQTQTRVSTLEHHLDKSRADHARNQDLLAKGFISERQLANSENALRQAEGDLAEARRLAAAAQAEVEGAQASVAGIERQRPALLQSLQQEAGAARAARDELTVARDELRVVAPVEGTVITRVSQAGELVSPGKPIVLLADVARPYLRVYLPEREIGKVKLGDSARVYVDSFPDRPFEAIVVEVANKAEFTPKDVHMPDERATLVYAVKLEIGNPQGVLKPGMPASAHIRWQPSVAWPPPPRS